MYMLYKVIGKKLKTLKFVVETYVGPFSKRITTYKGLEWLDFTECSAVEKCQNDPGPKRLAIWTELPSLKEQNRCGRDALGPNEPAL